VEVLRFLSFVILLQVLGKYNEIQSLTCGNVMDISIGFSRWIGIGLWGVTLFPNGLKNVQMQKNGKLVCLKSLICGSYISI